MRIRSCVLAAPLIVLLGLGCSEDRPAPAAGTTPPPGPVAKGTDASGKPVSKTKKPKELNRNLGPEGVVD